MCVFVFVREKDKVRVRVCVYGYVYVRVCMYMCTTCVLRVCMCMCTVPVPVASRLACFQLLGYYEFRYPLYCMHAPTHQPHTPMVFGCSLHVLSFHCLILVVIIAVWIRVNACTLHSLRTVRFMCCVHDNTMLLSCVQAARPAVAPPLPIAQAASPAILAVCACV